MLIFQIRLRLAIICLKIMKSNKARQQNQIYEIRVTQQGNSFESFIERPSFIDEGKNNV